MQSLSARQHEKEDNSLREVALVTWKYRILVVGGDRRKFDSPANQCSDPVLLGTTETLTLENADALFGARKAAEGASLCKGNDYPCDDLYVSTDGSSPPSAHAFSADATFRMPRPSAAFRVRRF